MDNYPYRPNVAMLVYRPSTYQLWIGERKGAPGHWQFPQGGVDLGSSLEENVVRELVEELGAPAHHFGAIVKLSATHRYDFTVPRDYGGEIFRGQDQTFWAVAFLGADSDINLLAHDPEFQNFRWVSSAEVRKLAPSRRLVGYEPALLEFDALVGSLKGGY